jgi:hypothetical protein
MPYYDFKKMVDNNMTKTGCVKDNSIFKKIHAFSIEWKKGNFYLISCRYEYWTPKGKSKTVYYDIKVSETGVYINRVFSMNKIPHSEIEDLMKEAVSRSCALMTELAKYEFVPYALLWLDGDKEPQHMSREEYLLYGHLFDRIEIIGEVNNE